MSDSEILNVLHEVERSAGGSFMERSIARGLILGPPICCVACIIGGNLLVLAGPHRAEAWTSSISGLTGVYGFCLGLFLGPIVDALRKDKKLAEQALESAMAKSQLSANDVARVLSHNGRHLPKTAGAFTRLTRKGRLQY